MDSPVQPSFIPRDASVSSYSGRATSGGLAELFLLISILLLIVSAALGVGVFLYTQYLTTTGASKLAQLNTAEAAFDPSLVQQLTRLDSRMRAGQALLSAHLAPTQLFAMLEQTTAQDISFSSLNYDASDPSHIAIKMVGVAGSVNSVALQAQLFSQSGVITSPIFSGIDREPDGVHFDFSALVNPSLLSYATLVSASSQGTAPVQSAAAAQAQIQNSQNTQTPASSSPSPFEPASASTTAPTGN